MRALRRVPSSETQLMAWQVQANKDWMRHIATLPINSKGGSVRSSISYQQLLKQMSRYVGQSSVSLDTTHLNHAGQAMEADRELDMVPMVLHSLLILCSYQTGSYQISIH